MNEELKAALEAMKVTLEGKSLDQAKAEIKAFEEKIVSRPYQIPHP